MVLSILEEKEAQNGDDPWLNEFSAIDPSVAPNRPEPALELPAEPAPEPPIELPPATARPETHFDPYGDDEPFDGFETVVREPRESWLPEPPDADARFAPLPYEPESTAETARRSGLAWSLGIMFFCSVAFMMLLGWGADLVLGTSPWGLVGGIILGSMIGFVQFFRTSSRMFNQPGKPHQIRPMLSDDEDLE